MKTNRDGGGWEGEEMKQNTHDLRFGSMIYLPVILFFSKNNRKKKSTLKSKMYLNKKKLEFIVPVILGTIY